VLRFVETALSKERNDDDHDRTEESTAVATRTGPTLLLAFELSERVWKVGFTTGVGQRPRLRHIPARATDRILEEIARAKVRFRLPTTTRVVSCYDYSRTPGNSVIRLDLDGVLECRVPCKTLRRPESRSQSEGRRATGIASRPAPLVSIDTPLVPQ
jgi:hypothetical protein